MTSNNLESCTIVDDASVKTDDNELKRETVALFEAIKQRATAEVESAGTLTQETYLNAVRQIRKAIEGDMFIERSRIENSWLLIQQSAEQNWHSAMKPVVDLNSRIVAAFDAAWEAFTRPGE